MWARSDPLTLSDIKEAWKSLPDRKYGLTDGQKWLLRKHAKQWKRFCIDREKDEKMD